MGIGLLSCCEKPKDEGVNKKINEGEESMNLDSPIIPNGPSKGETPRGDNLLAAPGNGTATNDSNLIPNAGVSNTNPSRKNKLKDNSITDINTVNIEDHIKFKFQSVRKLFFYFTKFELSYKFYDDFGLHFDPILVFKLNQNIEKTFSQKTEEENENKGDQINENSFNGDFNRSTNDKNKMSNSVNVNSNTVSNNLGSGPVSDNKYFHFDATKLIVINELEEDWTNKKLKLSIFNRSKYQQYNKIQVGFCHIPLSILKEQGIVEGKIPIRNKVTKIIGYIYTRIKCIYEEDKELLNLEDLENGMNAIIQSPSPSANDLYLSINDIVADYYRLALRLEFDNLDKKLQRRFRLKKIDVLMNIKISEKGWDEKRSRLEQEKEVEKIMNEEYTIKEIIDILYESMMKQQHIMIYGIFNYLIEKIEIKDRVFYDEFLDIIAEKEKNKEKEIHFFNLLTELFSTSNLALIKKYSYFLYMLIEYYREIEIESENCTTKINFDQIFTLLLDDFGHLNTLLEKSKDWDYEDIEEIREIIYWMLNDLMLLITPNVSEKIIKVEIINKLYSIGFNNCIKFISKPKYVIQIFSSMGTDSEIAALIVKIFRKALQILLDDSNNYILNTDNPKVVSAGIKDLIINDEKTYTFLLFIRMCLTQYVNYPEIFSNTLLVLIYFCMDYKYRDIVRHILDHIEVSLICSGFEMYRGNLKNIGKNINYFFYKLISHITELNKSFEEDETLINLKPSEIKEVCNDILKLFRMKESSNRNVFEKGKHLLLFIKNKNLDLHNQICVIAGNLTKNNDACKIICKEKCYFIQHITEYFFELNKDSIKRYLEKFKHNKKEKVNLYISIISNTLQMFDNLITRSKSSKDFFFKYLHLKNFTKNKVKYHITDLLDTTATTLSTNNNSLKKISENFMHNFD